MIGSPVEGTWDSVAGAAYYTGAGSGELVWTVIAAVICVLAIFIGGAHEARSYRNVSRTSQHTHNDEHSP